MLALLSVNTTMARQVDSPYISVTARNITIKEVLEKIEKETGYRFQYSADVLDNTRKVRFSAINKPLSYVMQQMLKPGLYYEVEGKLILILRRAGAASPTTVAAPVPVFVSGVITDDNDNPLIGASVLLKGGSTRAVADDNGHFALGEIKTGSALIVSNIGYKTKEIYVKPTGTITIKLEKLVQEMKAVEVVSNGYQFFQQGKTTGSVDVVNNALFNRTMSSDVLSRLEGTVAGLVFNRYLGKNNPNDISIRGVSTIGTTNGEDAQPLIILDNFPYDGNMDNINPNDIENVTILKDAASSSIWGARAGNGVIVITTKRGKFNQAPKLSMNANLMIGRKPDLFYQPSFTSAAFIEVERFLFDKGFYNSQLNNTASRPVISPVVELLAAARSEDISVDEANARIKEFELQDVRKDYEKYLYRPSVQQQYAVNVTGGNARLNYYFSAGYDKNRTNLVGDEVERMSFRSFTNAKVTKNLDVEVGLTFTETDTRNNSLGEITVSSSPFKYIPPYMRLADGDGKPLAIDKDFRTSFKDTVGIGKILDWKYKPIDEVRYGDNTSKLNDFVLFLGTRYKFSSYLSLDLKYQLEKALTKNRNIHSVESYFTRNLINLFTPTDGTTSQSIVPYGDIMDYSDSKLYSNNFRAQLNYTRSFFDKHTVDFIAGGEVKQREGDVNSGRFFGYDPDGPVRFVVPSVNQAPSYYSLQGSNYNLPRPFAKESRLYRFMSAYSNLTYNYDQRYILSGSLRRDASNVFGVTTNRKWNPLWSAGAGWIISNEKFYDVNWLSFLKLRLAHGYSGNSNVNVAAVLTLIQAPDNLFSNLPSQTIDNVPNPELRWEKVKTTNLGIDFSLKDNRLSGTIDVYRKNSEDLITYAPVDITSGFKTVTRNNAALGGHGVDLTLNTINLAGVLEWRTSLLFSYNRTKFAEFKKGIKSASSYIGAGSINPIDGQLLYGIVSYKWAGLDPATGDPMGYVGMDKSSDYVRISANTDLGGLVFHGSARPEISGSIRNTFTYKKFSLSFNITYELKYFFRNPYALSYITLYSNWQNNGYDDYMNRWKQPGDEKVTNVPSMIYPANSRRESFYSSSAVNVQPGDHVRLKDIVLDYPLKNIARKKGDLHFSLKGYANNIGIIWKKTSLKIDPSYRIPLPLNIGVGVKMSM